MEDCRLMWAIGSNGEDEQVTEVYLQWVREGGFTAPVVRLQLYQGWIWSLAATSGASIEGKMLLEWHMGKIVMVQARGAVSSDLWP